jgi:2-polyprenyl-3-methyl-5-hydroxy-6-metoxy-1,4-benzoquinol methylase
MIYQETNIATACRVCESERVNPVARVRDVAIERCENCGAAFAHYPQHSATQEHADHFAGLDLDRYFRSVKATRERSYDELWQRVRPLKTAGRWLDVGCSYGWLMEYMQSRGFEMAGVEPSSDAAAHAEKNHLRVYHGLFPEAVPAQEKFDVISFMDVLEHLPTPAQMLSAARELLHPQGLLIVQVPDQECFLYRLAEWLHWGSGGRCSFALERLWLMQFDFPHQTYFTLQSLQHLLTQQAWNIHAAWRSPVGNPREALDRVSYTQSNRHASWQDLLVALGVAGIQLADSACGHGGLLTLIASPTTNHTASTAPC